MFSRIKKGSEIMNKKLLRSLMVLNDDTNNTLAEALGITPPIPFS